jgi:hypothetical protein
MLAVFQHPQRPVARLIWIYAVGMMAFMGMNAVLALFLQAAIRHHREVVRALLRLRRCDLAGDAQRPARTRGAPLRREGGDADRSAVPRWRLRAAGARADGPHLRRGDHADSGRHRAAVSGSSRRWSRASLCATSSARPWACSRPTAGSPGWSARSGPAMRSSGSAPGAPFWISCGTRARDARLRRRALHAESPERAEAAKPPAGDAAKPEAPADGGA